MAVSLTEDTRACTRCQSEMTYFPHLGEWYCKGCGNRAAEN